MPERTSITQVVQLGAEVTPGTAVAANRLLPSLMLKTSTAGTFTELAASGYKVPTGVAPGKEWAAAKWEMAVPTYDELPYLLMGHYSYAAPVQQAATTAYKWTHALSSTTEDTIKTNTYEQGSAVRAHKFAYGLVTSFSMKGDRDKVSASGEIIGAAITDGVTLTATPTAIAQVPMLPNTFDVYIDPSGATLGTTKMTRVLEWEIETSGRFGPLWTVNSAVASFATHVELAIEGKVRLLVEADSAGMAELTNLRAGTPRFIRIKSTSAVLAGTAIPYSFTWDCAAVASEPVPLDDKDGVYAAEFSFSVIHDTTWAKALNCEVINKRTAI